MVSLPSLMHVSPLSWIALTCALIAALIMVLYLVYRPPLDARTKAVLALGLGVLPIMTALIGNVEGLRATESQAFCGSCHTMDLHIADANDPDSLGLAAIHSRTKMFGDRSCYVCHKDHGMYGYALTKLGGMGHVYYFLSDYMWEDVDASISRIHIARPFRNENCMQCHSTSGRLWSEVPDHRGLLEDLRTGQTSCASVGCHGYAHPFSKADEPGAEAHLLHDPVLSEGP
ncbi:MAG: NapC/NirT family cytochrome c [Myxococcota bacterium]